MGKFNRGRYGEPKHHYFGDAMKAPKQQVIKKSPERTNTAIFPKVF